MSNNSAEFLLEVGCEELPAGFVAPALKELSSLIEKNLNDSRLSYEKVATYGTCRRLIVSVQNVQKRQEDSTKVQKGPSLKAAYKEDGSPAPALIGFCKSNGVDVNSVEKRDDYIWIEKNIPGRETKDILAELIPNILSKLYFPKTMRWANWKMKFARPIRWIIAVLDEEVIPFEVCGIKSGSSSRGHRHLSKACFEAKNLDSLLSSLRANCVEPDASIRREKIINESNSLLDSDESIKIDKGLLEENTYLVENVLPILGSIGSEYMSLPGEIIQDTLAKHAKFFSIINKDGFTVPKFISIANSGDVDTIREGNEKLINARLNDAKFFYDKESNVKIDSFLDKTEGVLFQKELGTMKQVASRLSNICSFFADKLDLDKDIAAKCGLYSKADLSTELVAELPDLQGIIGSIYLAREGYHKSVCCAVRNHYKLESVLKNKDEYSEILFVANLIDRLTGFLAIGKLPSGSSDPFGLRRAINYLIIIAGNKSKCSEYYYDAFQFAMDLYENQGLTIKQDDLFKSISHLFIQRYGVLTGIDDNREILFSQDNHDKLDVRLLNAALEDLSPSEVLNVGLVRNRIQAAIDIEFNEAYYPLARSATRVFNLIKAAKNKEFTLPNVEGGYKLPEIFDEVVGVLESDPSLQNALKLTACIEKYLDNTMVLSEDESERNRNLAVLVVLHRYLNTLVNFSFIPLEEAREVVVV